MTYNLCCGTDSSVRSSNNSHIMPYTPFSALNCNKPSSVDTDTDDEKKQNDINDNDELCTTASAVTRKHINNTFNPTMDEIRQVLLSEQEKQDAELEKKFLLLKKKSKTSPRRVSEQDEDFSIDNDNDELDTLLSEEMLENSSSCEDDTSSSNNSGSNNSNIRGKNNSKNGNDKNTCTKNNKPKMVLYNKGATKLFKSIQEGEWDVVLKEIDNNPDDVRTWVISTGTANTTFQWSVWKRLPIHQACRRSDTPIEIFHALIDSYPESIQQTTQFGELPIHIACECGVSPTIINLLIIHNWLGCFATDQSGRTPLDVLQDAQLLDPIEQKQCVDAIQACNDTYYNTIVSKHNVEINKLQELHSIGLNAIQQQHDTELNKEKRNKHKLILQMEKLQLHINEQNDFITKQERALNTLVNNEVITTNRINQLEELNTTIQLQYHNEQVKNTNLQNIIKDKDIENNTLTNQIVELQLSLNKMTKWYETNVTKQLDIVQKQFNNTLNEFTTFTHVMNKHQRNLNKITITNNNNNNNNNENNSNTNTTDNNNNNNDELKKIIQDLDYTNNNNSSSSTNESSSNSSSGSSSDDDDGDYHHRHNDQQHDKEEEEENGNLDNNSNNNNGKKVVSFDVQEHHDNNNNNNAGVQSSEEEEEEEIDIILGEKTITKEINNDISGNNNNKNDELFDDIEDDDNDNNNNDDDDDDDILTKSVNAAVAKVLQ